MKYYIRTTLERKLDSSYNQIEYELLVDREHKNVKAFINQIIELSKLNEDCVILEDDIVLCKDFKSRIEKVISEYPDRIINFFYNPGEWLPEICEGFIFVFMQCVYFPKQILKLLADNLKKYSTGSEKEQSDLLVARILGSSHIRFLSYRPCLVQHLAFDTLIHDKVYKFRTPYFIDYLEDLGITYEEARTSENTDKLREYAREWFKDYEDRLHTS